MTTLRRSTATALALLLLLPALLRPQATATVVTEVRFTMPAVLVARLAGAPTVTAAPRTPATVTVPVEVLANTPWQLEVATTPTTWATVATGAAGRRLVAVTVPATATLPLRLRRLDVEDGRPVVVTLPLADRPVGP